VSDIEVARARHSETKEMLSVVSSSDGRLTVRPWRGDDDETFVGELPASALDPQLVGRWRHFKGGEYEFIGLVDDLPDGLLVLYLDADGRAWLRPRAMIDEVVESDGRRCPRFVRIGPSLPR
jgi:hypothetical protein